MNKNSDVGYVSIPLYHTLDFLIRLYTGNVTFIVE